MDKTPQEAVREAAEQVEAWWVAEGQWILGGAPVCIFNLRTALATPAVPSEPEKPSSESLLRAMARNYGDGPHQWDQLDKEACVRAADEIAMLRSISGTPPHEADYWRIRSLDAESALACLRRPTAPGVPEPAVRGDAEALRDAKRYRYIMSLTLNQIGDLVHSVFDPAQPHDTVDEAIDAALAQTPEGKDQSCPKP